MKFYLPFLTGHCRDPGELTLVRILTLPQLLLVLPGSNLQGPEQMEFKVDNIALVSTRIWQG